MAVPVQQKTWTISANNRIAIASYATLVLQGGKYLKTIADFLLANGYTCKGSSDATSAAMDGVNRWATDADASHQAANTTTAVSWMVLTDGNGADICLSFVGATGDIARISFSPSGAYVAAGTATFTPTATDEQVLFTGVSLITNSTVNDRIVNIWTDSEAKLMRVCTYVAGALADGNWGVELVNANRVTISYSPAVWGFAFITTQFAMTSSGFFAAFLANSRGGYARINGTTVNIFMGAEAFGGGSYILFNSTTKPELQKGIGQAMFPILIGTATTNRQGPIGNVYDWWTAGQGGTSGPGQVVFPSGTWILLNNSSQGGPVWPWDGTTIPQVA
jgi:hypothetical protein